MQRSAITPHATDLSAVADLRRRMVDQERRTTPGIILPPGRDAYAFHWPSDGPPSTGLSDSYLIRVTGTLFAWQGTLRDPGGTDTTVDLFVDGTLLSTVTFGAAELIAWDLPVFPVLARVNVLTAQVISVGGPTCSTPSTAIGLVMEALVQTS